MSGWQLMWEESFHLYDLFYETEEVKKFTNYSDVSEL